jgi:Tol biopolymer transport system component
MTTERRLDTRLHSIIGEIARGPYPDYIEDVLAGTAQRRQRPRWTFPERWLPMEIAAQPLQGVRRVPWQALALVALLVIVLAGALVLAGASPHVAPPFGRAANGVVAFDAGGDIKTVDPKIGDVTTLIAGPEADLTPVFSRDGTRMAFGRGATDDAEALDLVSARSDGTALVTLTRSPLVGLTGWQFSPDGRFVTAVAGVGDHAQLLIVPSDGSAPPRLLDVRITGVASGPEYRPDGSEILFVGKPNGSRFAGVHTFDPATGVVRTIVEGSATAEVWGAAWSPDGSRVAYEVFDTRTTNSPGWTHVVAADGTGDLRLSAPADVLGVGGFAWSNDGTRIVVVEGTNQVTSPETTANRSVVVSLDGTGQRVVLECAHAGFDCSGNFRTWSPDDSTLIGSIMEGETHYLADPATGRLWRSAWGGEGEPAWQRLAP